MEVKNELVKPLSVLLNYSLHTGTIHDDWKLSNITPTFKMRSRAIPNNYHLISIASVVCKVFETIIRDRLVKLFEVNCLLKDTQHGFRNKSSSLTNLQDFLCGIFNEYGKSKTVDITYFGYQSFPQAFNIQTKSTQN